LMRTSPPERSLRPLATAPPVLRNPDPGRNAPHFTHAPAPRGSLIPAEVPLVDAEILFKDSRPPLVEGVALASGASGVHGRAATPLTQADIAPRLVRAGSSVFNVAFSGLYHV